MSDKPVGAESQPCKHERLDEEGYCRKCGVDMRSGKDLTPVGTESGAQPKTEPFAELASCLDCKAPYGADGWCDVVIPSPIWNRIASPSDILCFRCMTKRIEKARLTCVPVTVVSGPYQDANEDWRLIGWNHGYKVGLEERITPEQYAQAARQIAAHLDPYDNAVDPDWIEQILTSILGGAK